jgi:hypothetical protein
MIGLCAEALRPEMPAGVALWSTKISETATSVAAWCAADE